MPDAPGSPAAVRAGCTCPADDNAHGAGIVAHWWGDPPPILRWVEAECPMHGWKIKEGDRDG